MRILGCHSLELRYLFDVGGASPPDAAQVELGDRMIDYWAEFVKTGDPGGDWKDVGDGVLSLQPDGDRMTGEYGREHRCDFWDGLR